ncbi:MAG TPA: serine hydrolase [Solirubrobacteraceae bacterium]|jgi:hypothetical protein
MLSALAVSAMLTALVAGIAGAWSPCGFSMVDTIGTALGDARRSATALACATFTAGAVTGGAFTFGGLAWLGHAAGGSEGMRDAFGATIALAAALADWRGVKIAPQIRRQVPERWRWTMPLPLACGLYGVLLGLGFTTFVLAFAVWALAGVSFAAGAPAVGLLVGGAFGVGRALPIVWMAPGLRSEAGAMRLEGMAAEPRVLLGLRRLNAIGLCLCALFLTGTVAQAATLTAASDPSATGAELAWQATNGTGMLRLPAGSTSVLPGGFPALGGTSIAWAQGGRIAVADRATLAVRTTIPATSVSALAVSDRWIVYRARAGGDSERLLAVSLPPSAPTQRLLASAPLGEIGRPALDRSTAVFALDTPTHAIIDAVNLTGSTRRRLRTSTYGATLANPSLLNGRLLYERTDRCQQQLLLGSPSRAGGERVLLSLPSTVPRDRGYEQSYEHAYNTASLCHNRGTAAGSTRLGSTALSPTTAYVTEIPANPAQARIVAISRGHPSRGSGAFARSTPAAIVKTPPPKAWQPDVRSAIAYARTRGGEVSFAVRTAHGVWGWHPTRTVPSASVLKAMLLVAYLDDPRVRDRPLTAADHRLIDPMIQRSDNVAASRVLEFVGPSGVYGVAARAGMRKFTLDPTIWGLSRIDAIDQARFFLHIDSHVVARQRATAMHLLATVTPSQRWGIGELRLPGWRLYFKGGWGSGTGAVEHQVALLRHGSIRVSLAVLITNSPSHAYAKQTLRGVFAILLRGVHQLLVPPAVAARE